MILHHREKKYSFKHCFLFPALISAALVLGGCSPQKKSAPVPKTKGLLLLEIYDAMQKKQYGTALQKIGRYRILDPASSAMAELESTVRYNHLVSVVRYYLKNNNFQGALSAVYAYERQYGITKRTVDIKSQLLFCVKLDQDLAQVKAAKSAHALELALKELEKNRKEKRLSPKIENFLRKERSKLKHLRQYERTLTGELLCTESGLQLQTDQGNDPSTAEILYALVKAVQPECSFLPELEKRLTLERIYPE